MRNEIKKKLNAAAAATLLLVVCLVCIFGVSSYFVKKSAEEICFSRLQTSVSQTSLRMYERFMNDKRQLLVQAHAIASYDNIDSDETRVLIKELNEMDFVDYTELLLPNNYLITKDGTYMDVSDKINFEEEVKKGEYISDRMQDFRSDSEYVVCNVVPVVKNGETVAILYGVIDAEKMSQNYRVRELADGSNLYVIDSDTGEFIINTWHRNISNTDELSDRKPKKGFSVEQFKSDIKNKKTGSTAFLSQTANEYFYAYYTSLGVNDWMLMITVPENSVFASVHKLKKIYYTMVAVIMLVLSLYFIWMINMEKREVISKRNQLGFVKYVLNVEKSLFYAYKDVDGIEEALRVVADKLTADIAFFILFSDSVIKMVYAWGTDKDILLKYKENKHIEHMFKSLEKDRSKIEYGTNITIGNGEEVYNVNNFMITAIRDKNNDILGVLGSINMKEIWEDAIYLENVAVPFFMAIDNVNYYQTIHNMSIIDALTNIRNRNSYQQKVEYLKIYGNKKFTCVYIDANELHALNNTEGHEAGDLMLCTIADCLKKEFGDEDTYRIGGDEFVTFVENTEKEVVDEKIEVMKKAVEDKGYNISIGMKFVDVLDDIDEVLKEAERNMIIDKYKYYQKKHVDNRVLDPTWRLNRISVSKRDSNIFLSAISTKFRGGYIVNFDTDDIRIIYVPPYFQDILDRVEGKFSKAIRAYVKECVRSKYHREFEALYDYDWIEKQLKIGNTPRIIYQKIEGDYIECRVVKSSEYSEMNREMVWIFETVEEK